MKINGKLLLQARTERGLTQAQLASGICTPTMISQVETGKALPSDELIHKLAERLDMPVTALIGDDA